MKNILIMAAMLSIGCIAMTQAQFDRTKQPQAGAAPSIKLPAVQRATLSNGLNIVVVEHHELPVVQMQMVFRTGASADPMGKAGTASLAAGFNDPRKGVKSLHEGHRARGDASAGELLPR